VEQLGDSALLEHNRKCEVRLWGGCIIACGLERLQPHLPFQGDNGLPTHNPWLILAIFIVSCSSQAEWIDILDSCDPCRCAQDYLKDSAFRLSIHKRQPRALGHGWGSALYNVGCDITILEMRSLSPKIISGDSRQSENTETHTYKHTVPYMKFKLKLLQIKCHVLEFTQDKAQNVFQRIIWVFAEAFVSHDSHTLFALEESGCDRTTSKWGVCLPRSYWGILDEARMRKHTQISIQYQIWNSS
jgi:hypothetical protein